MTVIYIYIYIYIYIRSIEATMTKADHTKTEEVYVCGFAPKHILPSKMPWSLDPFLLPLINEIEDLFINGMLNYVNIYHALVYCSLSSHDCIQCL